MHIPVMLSEVIDIINPMPGKVYIDATFGGGGYTKALLDAADCKVIAVDRDPEAEERAKVIQQEYKGRFSFVKGDFGKLAEIIADRDIDGIVFDIGVSSFQIDTPERGFSFKSEGPLDMRMSQKGLSAQNIINTYSEADLADIFWIYGEERHSRKVARIIVNSREDKPIETTKQLKDLISQVLPFERPGFEPSTRVFQALRIFVNNELKELEEGLKAAQVMLKSEGKLVVVSFHSLEDRIVKHFLYEASGLKKPSFSRHRPELHQPLVTSTFSLLQKKPISPSHEEITRNARSRSARLRWAVRTSEQMQQENQ